MLSPVPDLKDWLAVLKAFPPQVCAARDELGLPSSTISTAVKADRSPRRISTDLIGPADEDETCEECDAGYEVFIFDGWLALCRECAERDVAPDHTTA